MSKIIVVGGGASGVVAALKASRNNEVILLEGEDKILKKLLLTGNGKCNYWNSDISKVKYNSCDKELLDNIFTEENINDTYNYLEKLGIYPSIKNGYYYPYSNQASSIREIFITNLKKKHVKVITNSKVESITKENNGFKVVTESEEYLCDKVVLSAGSKSYPKTGSDGSGYNLAESFNHTITELTSALAPIRMNEKYLKDWNGVRCNVTLNLNINGKKYSESGELQLTDYGISGICVFNISSLISHALLNKEEVRLTINFLPFTKDPMSFMNDRYNNLIDLNLEEMLESIFNYKLLHVLFKVAGIKKESRWNEISYTERQRLIDVLTNFNVNIDEVIFDKGQVTSGGVKLSEVNVENFESKKVKDLYFTGELLDVDGICGGFNLGFAFISGYVVGRCLDDHN